jgi:hypothetical protein
MQQLKELQQFNKVYKKHKEKQVTHDKLKTGNKLNNKQNWKSLSISESNSAKDIPNTHRS